MPTTPINNFVFLHVHSVFGCLLWPRHLNRTVVAAERLFESGKSPESHFSKWNFIKYFCYARNFIKRAHGMVGYGMVWTEIIGTRTKRYGWHGVCNHFAIFNANNTWIVINCAAEKKLMLIIQFVLVDGPIKKHHIQTYRKQNETNCSWLICVYYTDTHCRIWDKRKVFCFVADITYVLIIFNQKISNWKTLRGNTKLLAAAKRKWYTINRSHWNWLSRLNYDKTCETNFVVSVSLYIYISLSEVMNQHNHLHMYRIQNFDWMQYGNRLKVKAVEIFQRMIVDKLFASIEQVWKNRILHWNFLNRCTDSELENRSLRKPARAIWGRCIHCFQQLCQ